MKRYLTPRWLVVQGAMLVAAALAGVAAVWIGYWACAIASPVGIAIGWFGRNWAESA